MVEINRYLPRRNYKTRRAHELMASAREAKKNGVNVRDFKTRTWRRLSEKETAEYISKTVRDAKGWHKDGMKDPREHPGLR